MFQATVTDQGQQLSALPVESTSIPGYSGATSHTSRDVEQSSEQSSHQQPGQGPSHLLSLTTNSEEGEQLAAEEATPSGRGSPLLRSSNFKSAEELDELRLLKLSHVERPKEGDLPSFKAPPFPTSPEKTKTQKEEDEHEQAQVKKEYVRNLPTKEEDLNWPTNEQMENMFGKKKQIGWNTKEELENLFGEKKHFDRKTNEELESLPIEKTHVEWKTYEDQEDLSAEKRHLEWKTYKDLKNLPAEKEDVPSQKTGDQDPESQGNPIVDLHEGLGNIIEGHLAKQPIVEKEELLSGEYVDLASEGDKSKARDVAEETSDDYEIVPQPPVQEVEQDDEDEEEETAKTMRILV